VLNMDEAGARVGCPVGEHIVVPSDVREHYTESPENRKSVTIIETIIADGREPLPPFIIAPGKHIMDNWVRSELRGEEWITSSPTGYTNNTIIMEYLDHLILHTKAGPNKPWKALLLDGHESHHYLPFQLKAAEHHIKLIYFPSHLTHALQPLDVGVFRPWKHWHNMAIQRAIRSLDFQYTITSFFRDLVQIRTDTMKKDTIVGAFRDSGIWPVATKKGIEKMRAYQKCRRSTNDNIDSDNLDLPAYPPTRADEMWEVSAVLRELRDRDPATWSSPTKAKHKRVCTTAGVIVEKTQLLTVQHSSLQEKIKAEQKRKNSSRRHVHKGGPGATIAQLRQQMRIRDDDERGFKIKKARKNLQAAINKYRKELIARGVQARKDEKARIARIIDAELRGELLVLEEYLPIRQPDKDPNLHERTLLTVEGYPSLLLAVQQLEREEDLLSQEIRLVAEDSDQGVGFILGVETQEEVGEYVDSSPPPREYTPLIDSSDIESDTGSIDSIARNASFVGMY
jgi:hypothetical protein